MQHASNISCNACNFIKSYCFSGKHVVVTVQLQHRESENYDVDNYDW